ncbi:MAG: hypothetical protein LLF76_10425 [Planctomycetaceae bacterium]|nr:hypothetical protein [Planctomycetaceae bacterium]
MRLKEIELIEKLTAQEDILRPLLVDSIQKEIEIGNSRIDAAIRFSIQDGPSFTAAVEMSVLSTPKAITERCKTLVMLASELRNRDMIPMIIAPYINENQSKRLQNESISWIDLSGNMLIKAPPAIYIERIGRRNKYPDTSPIKNIYKGTSSLVCRALLLNADGFSSLNKIADFINARKGAITLATVSKVLKSLEESLLVTKEEGGIRVKQPAVLLENLAAGYANYLKNQQDRRLKYDIENINDLAAFLSDAQVDYAYCGFYAAQLKGLGITEQITLFVKSLQDIQKALRRRPDRARPDEEYGQVTFIETNNPCVWFNMRNEPSNKVVDDLELYLELVNDTPRGPKIANQLKEKILAEFNP